jgi:hypothetical protein
MRIAITTVVLAMLIGTAAFADGHGLLNIYGPNGTYFAEGGAGEVGTAAQNWTNTWGASSWWGVYDKDVNAADEGLSNTSAAWAHEISTGPLAVRVAADVELWCETTMAATQVYFHFGDTRSSVPDAMLSGTMASNSGEWVGISLPGNLVDTTKVWQDGSDIKGIILEAKKDALERPIAETLPVEIFFKDSGDTTWRHAADVNYGSSSTYYGLWWKVAFGSAGSFGCDWLMRPQAGTYQADGHYEFDPVMCVNPVL